MAKGEWVRVEFVEGNVDVTRRWTFRDEERVSILSVKAGEGSRGDLFGLDFTMEIPQGTRVEINYTLKDLKLRLSDFGIGDMPPKYRESRSYFIEEVQKRKFF